MRNILCSMCCEYMTPRYDFARRFKTSFSDNGIRKVGGTHQVWNFIQIYTDCSKVNGAVGSGIFSESVKINQSIRLPDHYSIFQTEAVAIQVAARIIGDGWVPKRNVTILSDSQAAIRALNCNIMNSKMLYACSRYFDEITEWYKVLVVWVLGHSGIPGNCRTNLPGGAQPHVGFEDYCVLWFIHIFIPLRKIR